MTDDARTTEHMRAAFSESLKSQTVISNWGGLRRATHYARKRLSDALMAVIPSACAIDEPHYRQHYRHFD